MMNIQWNATTNTLTFDLLQLHDAEIGVALYGNNAQRVVIVDPATPPATYTIDSCDQGRGPGPTHLQNSGGIRKVSIQVFHANGQACGPIGSANALVTAPPVMVNQDVTDGEFPHATRRFTLPGGDEVEVVIVIQNNGGGGEEKEKGRTMTTAEFLKGVLRKLAADYRERHK